MFAAIFPFTSSLTLPEGAFQIHIFEPLSCIVPAVRELAPLYLGMYPEVPAPERVLDAAVKQFAPF